MSEAVFETERRTDLGKATCPKCGAVFKHEKVEHVSVTYEVKASIMHKNSHPKDRTSVSVESTPFDVLPYGTIVFYPSNIGELKKDVKDCMVKYRAKAWIFGLASDKAKQVVAVEQVDEAVDKAIEYMQQYGFTPKFS